MSYHIERQKNLAAYNTMGLPSLAEHYYRLESVEAIEPVLAYAQEQQLPVYVLAGGSNSLLGEYLHGLLLHIALQGIDVIEQNEQQVLVKVAAGEIWDEFLQYCLAQGFYGLENLAIIPGTVGAAPIQNIGAYGVEVASFIRTVHAYDREQQKMVMLSAEQCQFAYRDSVFKRQQGRYLVTAVEFVLNKQFSANLSYQALKDRMQDQTMNAATIRQAVIAQRNSRLPNPTEIPNAGSFFKNPVIDAKAFQALQSQYPSLPYFNDGERFKIPAAWLIEQSGWKGKRLGAVGMYEKQALVMINHGGAKLHDVQALAAAIIQDVQAKFAISLEAEPQTVV